MFGGLTPGATVTIESFMWIGKTRVSNARVGDTITQAGHAPHTSDKPRSWVVGERTDWETLGNALGRQEGAPYMKADLRPKIVIRCTGCRKQCNKARGETLTRKGVWCNKCYSPDKHGPTSTTTNYYTR